MVFERLSRAFKKLPFKAFEPTIPVFTAYFLNKELERKEEEGSIHGFKVKAGRIEKRHYTLDLELTLTEEQAQRGISSILDKLPNGCKEVICNG